MLFIKLSVFFIHLDPLSLICLNCQLCISYSQELNMKVKGLSIKMQENFSAGSWKSSAQAKIYIKLFAHLQRSKFVIRHRFQVYRKIMLSQNNQTFPMLSSIKNNNRRILMRYNSQAQACQFVEQVLGKAYYEIKLKKVNKVMQKKQSAGYLQYIQNVSQLMHVHRQPIKEEPKFNNTAEPDEATTTRKRFQFAWYEGQKISNKDTEKQMLRFSKKFSICLSQRQRKSQDRSRSRKYISRRKIQQQKEILVPLFCGALQPNDCDKRIEQMRKKKLKLEQALRKFTQQELEIQKDSKKKKQTLFANYTTDFRGKVLPFCSKSNRSKDSTAFGIKVQTVLQPSLPWGKTNFTATAHRGFKEPARDFTQKQNKTEKASQY